MAPKKQTTPAPAKTEAKPAVAAAPAPAPAKTEAKPAVAAAPAPAPAKPAKAEAAVATSANLTFTRKIKNVGGKARKFRKTEFRVAKALFDIEVNNKELKAELQSLQFYTAKQIDIKGKRKAVVIFVPLRQVDQWRRASVRVVRELEKKFSNEHVLIVGRRTALPTPTMLHEKRPIARTRTVVHENLLEDVCYPCEVVGKRTRYHVNGQRSQRVLLDAKEKPNFENKLSTFGFVYKRLTGQRTKFEFSA